MILIIYVLEYLPHIVLDHPEIHYVLTLSIENGSVLKLMLVALNYINCTDG